MNWGMLGWQLTAADLFNKADDATKLAAMGVMGGKLNPTAQDRAALTLQLANGQQKSAGDVEQAKSDASLDASNATQQQAAADATTAINSGVSKARAGLLGDLSSNSNTSQVYGQSYNAYMNNAASTQADYLKQMGQLYDMNNQVNNAKRGATNAIIGSTLQGAATGAATGFSLSDENCKEPATPTADSNNDGIDDDKLLKSMQQFIDLYNQLEELKK